MSWRAMKLVWESSISPPTTKLALLALADFLNDKTGQLNPSLQSIATKIGVTRGQAQRIIRSFIEQGLLSVMANQFGGAPGTTPQYRLHLDRIVALMRTDGANATPTDGTDATGRADATGSTDARDGWHGRRGRVAPMPQTGSTGATQTTMNPYRTAKEPLKKKTRATAKPRTPSAFDLLPEVTQQVTADWQQVRKAKRVGAITGTVAKSLRTEAGKAEMSLQQVVELCCGNGWASFKASWLHKGHDRKGTGARHPTAVDRQVAMMNRLTGKDRTHHEQPEAPHETIDIDARDVG